MYHFTADHPPEPVRLSFRALIPGHIRQYLKDFQLDAIRFMHNFLAKGEFCVYNDESGLGKQAAVAVLLDAACSSKKCLIVVQNDDRYVNGWDFHFNVLTNTNVTVIKDEKDSTDSPHNIYIAKWSTLRTIDDLTKFKFDFIILDNRGQMLNNSFCTSMLLKHYERKINILISSVDITSDLKLLHNCLRLGGRLDPQYSSFKTFEEKFKLPDAKELAYKRVDLEEYFCKRERLADYCKVFRLRRYCHQYEKQLPLVKEDRYKINLELWREKQNATNSESSSIEYVNNQNREDEHIKDTQELFEEYCRQRRKQHLEFQQEEEKRLQQREREMLKSIQTENEIIYNVDDEVALINDTPPMVPEKPSVARDNSDEPVLMSPLLVESDSDADDVPEICNDPNNDIEIVDLSREEKEDNQEHNKQNKPIESTNKSKPAEEKTKSANKNNKASKMRRELARLDEDIVDALKIKETPKRLTRHKKEEDASNSSTKRLKDRLEEKRADVATSKRTNSNERTPKSSKNNANNDSNNTKSTIKAEKPTVQKSPEKSTTTSNNTQKPPKDTRKAISTVPELVATENCNTPKNTKTSKDNKKSASISTNSKSNINSNAIEIKETNKTSHATSTPLTSRKARTVQNVAKTANQTPTKNKDNQVHIKQELVEETPQTQKTNSKDTQTKVNSERKCLKREMEITPSGVHHKQTRSMQRLTRSAGGGSKYLTKNLALQIDKINKPKKKPTVKEITPKPVININKPDVAKYKEAEKNTQTSIISHRSSQDYESLQCAQRLSGAAVFDNGLEKSTEFLVPATPNVITRNSLIPSSLTSSAGFFTESEVIFIPPTPTDATTNRKRDQVISLSSSENENSTSQSSSTNISTTSRRTRALKPNRKQQQQQSTETSKVPSFSELLAQQNTRASAKSPDLFSNCSDLLPLPCTQPNLDSEEPNTPFEGFKIFGSEVKQLQQHYAFSKNNNANKLNPSAKKSYRDQRSCLDILEKMFEPPNKKSKQTTNEKSTSAGTTPTKKATRNASGANKQKTQNPILPSHPIEAIAEARQQQEIQKRKRSAATAATASTSGLQEDEIFEITNNGTFGSVMRLHSNGEISPVQHTQKSNTKQHNKITNYLIGSAIQNGSSGSQEEAVPPNSDNSAGYNNTEAGTPSKRHQQLSAVQNSNVKKSPKGKCNSTQATKLTKWFTKPSELSRQPSAAKAKSSNSKKTPTKQVHVHVSQEVDLTIASQPTPPPSGKRILKRRRLDLSFNK
ncbi:protein suppressor of underreplication [Calliphora vicina]|uniref:protein suppressor of underreplication n=1 Tax=Calliphora vicina TaxID=7373 RepID=UPI00325C0B0B